MPSAPGRAIALPMVVQTRGGWFQKTARLDAAEASDSSEFSPRVHGGEPMRFLNRAYQLGAARGYFAYPEVRALAQVVPDWFRQMSEPAHLAAFEQRHGIVVPASL